MACDAVVRGASILVGIVPMFLGVHKALFMLLMAGNYLVGVLHHMDVYCETVLP